MSTNAILDTLTQMAGDNPTMKQLVNLYQVHQSTQSGKTEELEIKYKKSLIVLKRYQEETRKMEEKLSAVEDDLSELSRLNDVLAAAIGACPTCFGKNWNCSFCHGRGKPGTFDIDHEAFEQFILPIFRKSGWHTEIIQKTTVHS